MNTYFSNRSLITGGSIAVLAGIALFLLVSRRHDTDPSGNSGREPTREQQMDPEQQTENKQNESIPPGPENVQSNETNEAPPKKSGTVTVSITMTGGPGVVDETVHLFLPDGESSSDNNGVRTGTSDGSGRITWSDVPVGSGYRVGLDPRRPDPMPAGGPFFPDYNINPPFEGKEEIIQNVENRFESEEGPEFETLSGTFAVQPGRETEVDITYQTESGLRGHVLTPGRKPAEDAELVLYAPEKDLSGEDSMYSHREYMETAEDGSFTVPEPPAGRLIISVEWRDPEGNIFLAARELHVSPNAYRELSPIVLGGGRSIELHFEFSGEAADAFRQMLKREGKSFEYFLWLVNHPEQGHDDLRIRCSADIDVPGSVRITGLRSGAIDIHEDPNFKSFNREKPQYPRFNLEPKRIRGGGEHGEFSLDDSEYTVEIPVHYRTRTEFIVQAGFVPREPVELQIRKEGTIEVREMMFPPKLFEKEDTGIARKEKFLPLDSGPYTLVATSPRDSGADNIFTKKTISLDSSRENNRVQIEMYRGSGARLKGHVYNTRGEPVKGQSVAIYRKKSRDLELNEQNILRDYDKLEFIESLETKEGGQVLIRGLQPGTTYVLSTDLLMRSGADFVIKETGVSRSTRTFRLETGGNDGE